MIDLKNSVIESLPQRYINSNKRNVILAGKNQEYIEQNLKIEQGLILKKAS